MTKPAPSNRVRKRPLRLGLDLDGVFANFNEAAGRTIVQLTKRHLVPTTYTPNTWDWMGALGYRKSEIDRFWKFVNLEHPTWWVDLPAYPSTEDVFTVLQRQIAAGRLDVTFLTTRPARTAHAQSVEWLFRLGIDRPQVCITHDHEHKGLLAKGLRLDAFIDDSPRNLHAIREIQPSTALGFYEQPWSVHHRDAMVTLGAHVVKGLTGLERLVARWTGGGN